ncbi:hypothetical protein LEP1GSC060_2697 [Leptospira weilii serovar Ranarum str. ICFT]|uniref:Uncharacterized protein n=1 Tax=Leptospira weilii serovar Ranarum str. ICFT TaxID=1218598 RepID=N1WC99_9LEPT|nr:hypothetical protein LEP1GSC060_2697 [Leptospira weilii serovar Ranarum str. ICFT]
MRYRNRSVFVLFFIDPSASFGTHSRRLWTGTFGNKHRILETTLKLLVIEKR